jgi:predicted phage baseplate assembly protein
MSCQHECEQPLVFPRPIFNRPGLDSIAYRIGSYADMRSFMLGRLDEEPALARFTHRKADDPAIALIESAAIVGDILSFYQQLYANEAFLRTAQWRESVADLVKLLGYRLAPGLGGHARFALVASGTRPVTVPQGFGFKAQLDGAPKPADFETSAAVTAYPGLSEFHLYRPRYTPSIVNGTTTFVVGGATDAVSLKAGDKIMVGVARADDGSLDHSQILIVDKTWVSFGMRYVTTKGAVTCLDSLFTIFAPGNLATMFAATKSASAPFKLSASALTSLGATALKSIGSAVAGLVSPAAGAAESRVAAAGELRAYKIGGSFRHFGHNAPPVEVSVDGNGRASSTSVSYVRNLAATTSAPASPPWPATHVPLDGAAPAISAGTLVLAEGPLYPVSQFIFLLFGSAPTHKRVIERRILAVDQQSLAWGPQSGASTVLTLERSLALSEGGTALDHADIRNLTFHQVEGDAFSLTATPEPIAAASGNDLYFYGSGQDAAALTGRAVLLAGPGTTLAAAQVSAADASGATAGPAFHRITLDQAVNLASFDYDQPTVTVYGNLVPATEGKSGSEVALGDGDARQTFQTFPLPKPPLTYLLAPASDPPQAPELSVYVAGRLWTRVDSFFTSAPRDPVYVVREDADGKSYVQFGDGKTGARLPSGRANVTAQFRSGSGSHGPLKPDAKPQATGRLPGLDKAYMPEPVTGGAAPEDADSARTAAPANMQSLARLVSLADIEATAQAIAGVLRAGAAWDLSTGLPRVSVTILTLSRSAADAAAVADALLTLYQARGPARYPLSVVAGKRRQLRITAKVGYDRTYRAQDVTDGIVEALGAGSPEGSEPAQGLFGWQQRRFGEGAHGSQIVAAIQNVPGVVWVELTAAGVKGLFTFLFAPGFHIVPVSPERQAITCPPDSMLALDTGDLALSLTQAQTSEV